MPFEGDTDDPASVPRFCRSQKLETQNEQPAAADAGAASDQPRGTGLLQLEGQEGKRLNAHPEQRTLRQDIVNLVLS